MRESTCRGPRVGVGVGVAVPVGVGVLVEVAVGVGVEVGVGVLVNVAVAVGDGEAVNVGDGRGVEVGVGVASRKGSNRPRVPGEPQAVSRVLSPASRRKPRRLKGRRAEGCGMEWGASSSLAGGRPRSSFRCRP